jgi:hypothetical protein
VTTVCVVSTAGYQYSNTKVRPRTSAWYSLHVDATRQNVILPDLPSIPVPRTRYNGIGTLYDNFQQADYTGRSGNTW